MEYVLDNGGEDLVTVGFGIVEVFDGKIGLGVADDIESNGFGTLDRKSTRLNSSHIATSRMPSSA